ncbi:hypothetical protein POJ06DRAFT_245079 [Lipomyces tetrasporus]|uniref:ATPase expression protein 2, mitochondrial n=1 Tax=Lipomyces tetrasporus TaxID=54092 RepID=A0AAD7QZD2_9ASCO|nr:uncharacterized protein POJ06DRAFT_245079 [Lipomyces tetrasporus]KAJ8102587.1 hypothetical protein POJ06DRAFT_245079 [Lipomyces tetrasporus]
MRLDNRQLSPLSKMSHKLRHRDDKLVAQVYDVLHSADAKRWLRPTPVSAYYDSALRPPSGSTRQSDSPYHFGSRVPAFTTRPSMKIPEYRNVMASIARDDSFQIWLSYLALREYCFKMREKKRDMHLDRSVFTAVYLSLKFRNLVGLTAEEVRRMKMKDGISRFQGVRVKASKPVSPSLISENSRKALVAFPSEKLPFLPASKSTKYVLTAANVISQFWARLHTVRDDIETLFGALSRVELMHWLDSARAAGSAVARKEVWQRINDGLNPQTEDEEGLAIPKDLFELTAVPVTAMWNSYIASVCQTGTRQLKRVKDFGNLLDTESDPINAFKDEDYKEWLLDYIKVDYEQLIVRDYSNLDSKSDSVVDVYSQTSIFDNADAKSQVKAIATHLRVLSAEALLLVESMIVAGVLPNVVTYEILMLAFAKSGMLEAVRTVMQTVWRVSLNEDIPRHDTIRLGSRLYPTQRTLMAVYNAFAVNGQPSEGEKYIDAMHDKYMIRGVSDALNAVRDKWRTVEAQA